MQSVSYVACDTHILLIFSVWHRKAGTHLSREGWRLAYYTSILALTWGALAVLGILIWENNRIKGPDKFWFYTTFALIAFASLMEWSGLRLADHEQAPPWILRTVKWLDYTVTPMAGYAFIRQMRIMNQRVRMLQIVLVVNAVFQAVSVFSGWMLVFEEHNRYTHGPLYPFYIGIYLLVIVVLITEFISYGKLFRRQNRASLYATMLLVIGSIALQELLGGEVRTAYIGMTMASALIFIHNTEFSQLLMEDSLLQQEAQLMKDVLTGVGSRFAFQKALEKLDAKGPLPEDQVVLVMDINELKSVNDNLGHALGDDLICGAASCIDKVLGDVGKCFRTGGDEFVVLAALDEEKLHERLETLEKTTQAWQEKVLHSISLSIGFARAGAFPGMKADALVREADMMMYADKAEFYRKSGHERRRSRRGYHSDKDA